MHEINLLPPQRRQSLQRTTLLIAINKFLASLLWAIGVVTAGGVTAIVCFWILSIIASGSTQSELQLTLQQYRAAQTQQNQQAAFLSFVQNLGQNRLLWSDLLKDFFVSVPPGVTISSLSGQLDDKDKTPTGTTKPSGQILFGGQAVARSTLTIFADRLRLIPEVSNVEAPNANLIERDNPQYTFKLIVGSTTTTTKTPATAPTAPSLNPPLLNGPPQ